MCALLQSIVTAAALLGCGVHSLKTSEPTSGATPQPRVVQSVTTHHRSSIPEGALSHKDSGVSNITGNKLLDYWRSKIGNDYFLIKNIGNPSSGTLCEENTFLL